MLEDRRIRKIADGLHRYEYRHETYDYVYDMIRRDILPSLRNDVLPF